MSNNEQSNPKEGLENQVLIEITDDQKANIEAIMSNLFDQLHDLVPVIPLNVQEHVLPEVLKHAPKDEVDNYLNNPLLSSEEKNKILKNLLKKKKKLIY
jgi:hypothetical protein